MRVGMRDHCLNGIAGRRQACNVDVDHFDVEVGRVSPAGECAGGRLRSRAGLLQERDITARTELGRGEDDRSVGIDVVHRSAVYDQVLEA